MPPRALLRLRLQVEILDVVQDRLVGELVVEPDRVLGGPGGYPLLKDGNVRVRYFRERPGRHRPFPDEVEGQGGVLEIAAEQADRPVRGR